MDGCMLFAGILLLDYRFVVLIPFAMPKEEDEEDEGRGDRGVCMGVRQRSPDDTGDFNPSLAIDALPAETVVPPW